MKVEQVISKPLDMHRLSSQTPGHSHRRATPEQLSGFPNGRVGFRYLSKDIYVNDFLKVFNNTNEIIVALTCFRIERCFGFGIFNCG